MYRLFFTPEWFNGWDLFFEGVGLLVAVLIAAYSWRVYRISKENKYGFFSFAFILVSLAFVSKMLVQGLLYFKPLRNIATDVLEPVVGMAQTGINYSDLFFRGGFLIYMITMLGAWLLIFFISQGKSGRRKSYYEVSQIALFIYFVVLISIVSNFKHFVFYLTSAVILGMTVLNYYKTFLNNNKNMNTLLVMTGFLFLLISQFFFVFVFLSEELYILGEVLMVMGFLLLLYTYRKVRRR
ncbi:hypothetical protein GOV03_01155 [Candidatus Woesearchaeota archaeon]|nr:hypothetical protein [Candidatus Woesearchaeota archaeon]